eukprot:9375187-Pyramimonas_sp.AAC.1
MASAMLARCANAWAAERFVAQVRGPSGAHWRRAPRGGRFTSLFSWHCSGLSLVSSLNGLRREDPAA